MHRGLHTRAMFRRAHLTHHKSRTPTPWAAYSFAPIEGVLEGMFLPLFLAVVPMHAIVVLAEGVKENAARIMQYFESNGGMAGFELRATVLGHVVRGAPPTAFDRLLATRLGVAALASLAEGVSGVLIGEQRGEITRTPLAEIAGRTKPISTNLIELARVLAK
ncbi:MAG: hypothetical protein GY844_24630 [Bradyrhizobium sp.]|nr:hypothetical protein [Bradyrhizobium sp.]